MENRMIFFPVRRCEGLINIKIKDIIITSCMGLLERRGEDVSEGQKEKATFGVMNSFDTSQNGN